MVILRLLEVDQSQSLNLFMESPTIGKLSSMYLYAWQQGLKTTYYMRSRPATRINKTTAAGSATTTPARAIWDEKARLLARTPNISLYLATHR